jgi:hypothetical protein
MVAETEEALVVAGTALEEEGDEVEGQMWPTGTT